MKLRYQTPNLRMSSTENTESNNRMILRSIVRIVVANTAQQSLSRHLVFLALVLAFSVNSVTRW